SHLRLIEQVTKSKMKRIVPPTNQEAARGKQQATANNIVKAIEENEWKSYNETATELLENHDSVSIISAALKLLTKEREDVPVQIAAAEPANVKNNRGGGKGRGRGESNRRNKGGKRFYNKRHSHGKGQGQYQNRNKSNYKNKQQYVLLSA